jgi:RES domain-containing protein
LILIVPSVVARIESNILINPEHPEFPKIETSLHQPVWWDKRLFAR